MKAMKEKVLLSAYRKIRQFCGTREWYGYLTPCEMLALLNDGGREHRSYMYQRERIQSRIKEGDCSPSCFYFFPSTEQVEKLREITPAGRRYWRP